MEQKVIKLSEFKPRSYQLPIIDALENKGYKRILAIMPRRCLSGSTHIIMRNGSYKLLKDIKPGDEVLSWDGNSFVPDKVTDIWSTGLKKARDVRSYDYPGVISAYEHSFATAQPGDDSIKFSTVNDFTRDTILLHYAGIQGDTGRSRACKPLEAEFLGYLLSSIADLSENRILFKSSRRDILERIAECSEQIFGVPPAWREYSGIFSVFFSLTNHKYINVVDFIQKIDLAYIIKNRKLSTFVWELDEESLIHLFRGLLIVDGRIDLYKAMFQPTSLDLDARDYGRIEILISICHFAGFEYEIYWLFRKIGIVPSVPFVGDKNLKQMGIRNTGDCMRILRSGVWWCNEANQRCAIERIKHMPPSQRTYNKGCYLGDCYSYPAHSECLYDIEVEKNGNFVANGYLVHNSGKDITAFNLCIRQCLRKPCVVFYVFPTYSQAKKVIWDSVTNDGRRILDFIPRDVVHSLNSQEMKVRFVNQSLLQLVGSDNFDSLMGTNPQGVVFSEYALQDERCYQYIRPILTANDGWALFLSCVVGNTLVLTPDGLRPIDSLCSSRTDYTDYNKPIYGINGFNNASDFYYGGIQPTLKIKTHLGFSIECTPVHKLWTGSEWKQAADCRRGDLLPIQYGQMVFADSEPVAWLSLPIRCPSDHIEHPVYSVSFYGARMLLSREHSSSNYKDIHSPYTDSIEQFLEFQRLVCVSTKETQIQFLRGIFDALSYTASRKELRGNILLIITNQEFRAVLQSMLLNFGIVSACVHEDGLVIKKMSLHKFYRDIGFAHKNKQWHWKYVPSHVRDEDPITPNLYYDPIVSIEDSSAEVFDFVIPETHSFFSNGFVSHNTPRGKNHLYDLYQIAKQSPLWFCYKLTVDDTCHISAEDIQRERDEGIMSEDLIQQEYYTSWTMGVEGAYYAKYIDKLRLSGHIGNVPWDPSFKVNTSWDLGVRDSTTIIFFQIVGGSYHIIDCYDNAKEGLEHYVKVVSEKPYVYGKHIAPHDIRVREFTSGVARIDKARQLGIKFTVASDVSVMDGIEMVRTTLPRCYFDQSHCASLVKALENYRQEFDVKRKVYKDHPLHDQFSHYADAFRYLCVSLPKTRDGASPDDLDKRYREALYGSEQNLPSVFRDF